MATIQCGTVRFENIQAVIFDKDGTLADSRNFLMNLGRKRSRLIDAQIPGVQEPLLMAFGLIDEKLNPAGLLAVGTRFENEIAAAAYVAETGRDWIESLDLVRSAFLEADKVFQRKADSTPLFDGALELLQRLAKKGIKLGIISSDTPENVQDFLERYQLTDLIQVGLGSEWGLSKPDPKLFHKACHELNVLASQTLGIGDSMSDIEMAQRAGAIGCLGVQWGWSSFIDLSSANHVAQGFEEIQVFD